MYFSTSFSLAWSQFSIKQSEIAKTKLHRTTQVCELDSNNIVLTLVWLRRYTNVCLGILKKKLVFHCSEIAFHSWTYILVFTKSFNKIFLEIMVDNNFTVFNPRKFQFSLWLTPKNVPTLEHCNYYCKKNLIHYWSFYFTT